MIKVQLLSVLIFLALFVHAQSPLVDIEGDTKIVGKIDIIKFVGDSSVFIGANAGMNDDGANENTFVGGNAGRNNTSGYSNSFFGRSAGLNNTDGDDNSFFGRVAGFNNTEGLSNSFFGRAAGFNNTTGSSNSFFGRSAGSRHNNTRSTMLGYDAETTDSLDRAISIGYNAEVSCHNCAVIGGTGADAVKLGIGTTTPTSDLYIKQSDVNTSVPTTGGITLEDDGTTNKWQINADGNSFNFALNGAYKAIILSNGNYVDLVAFRSDTDQTKSSASNLKSMDDVLNKVNKLQPSTKQISRDKSNRTEWGFVAEDVAKVFPEITPMVNGKRGIIPHYFGILSIKAIQELTTIVEDQEIKNSQLEKNLQDQNAKISSLENKIAVLSAQLELLLEK